MAWKCFTSGTIRNISSLMSNTTSPFQIVAKLLMAAMCLLILSGCGGGGGGSSESQASLINGSAVKGLIADAIVDIYAIDPRSQEQRLIASSTTNELGEFTVNQSILPEDHLILLDLRAASDTTMKCDLPDGCYLPSQNATYAFGDWLPVPNNFRLQGVLHRGKAHITPLSHIAIATAQRLPGGLTNGNLSTSKSWLADLLGISHDIFLIKAPDLTASIDSTLSLAELEQALWSAIFFEATLSDEWSNLNYHLASLPLLDLADAAETLATTLSATTLAEQLPLDNLSEHTRDIRQQASNQAIAILRQPSAQTAAAGESVVLYVAAASEHTIQYQWLKDGQNIPGANSPYYIIDTSNEEDSGQYSVSLSVADSIYSSIEVEILVQGPVQGLHIIEHPQNQTLVNGDTLLLEVSAQGDSGLSYQWQKNGSILPTETSSSLLIHNIDQQDAGNYRVIVSDGYQQLSSDFAQIIVTDEISPIQILSHPENIMANIGTSASFSVESSGGGYISYQWFKDGEAIADAYTATLSFDNINIGDQGVYQVRVSNSQGSLLSNSANLSVLTDDIALRIIQHPESKTVQEGDYTSFSVLATSDSDVSYQWQKDNQILVGGNGSRADHCICKSYGLW